MNKQMHRRMMIRQKLIGLAILALCALLLWVCSTGVTPEDRDGTAVLLLAPMGFYLIFSKDVVIES